MSAITRNQRRVLTLLSRGGFIKSVAGWHLPDNSIGAFQTQTMMGLVNRGLARLKYKGGRVERAVAAFITAEGRAELERVPVAASRPRPMVAHPVEAFEEAAE